MPFGGRYDAPFPQEYVALPLLQHQQRRLVCCADSALPDVNQASACFSVISDDCDVLPDEAAEQLLAFALSLIHSHWRSASLNA